MTRPTSVEDALIVKWQFELHVQQLFQKSSVSDDVASCTPRLITQTNTRHGINFYY